VQPTTSLILVAVPSGWVDELSLFLGGNMPAIRIPVYTRNPINFSLDPETAPAALEITEITYTMEDCQTIIQDILDYIERLYIENSPLIECREMLCIISRNDKIALDWYFNMFHSRTYALSPNNSINGYFTPHGVLRFTVGDVKDPIIAQMP